MTILSRGRSLGHTLVLPTEDKYTQTRAEMIDTLAYALGGRAAEELVFHEPTTGAGNDIEKATQLARAMITQYGMSSKLGAIKYGTSGDEPFLGRNMGHERDYWTRWPPRSTARCGHWSSWRTTRPGRSWWNTGTSWTASCSS